jgi:hypothetical protein
MLKLRSIGISDYSVLEGRQRIGRIRFVIERMPGVWLERHHPPHGLLPDFNTAKAEFKASASLMGRGFAFYRAATDLGRRP